MRILTASVFVYDTETNLSKHIRYQGLTDNYS